MNQNDCIMFSENSSMSHTKPAINSYSMYSNSQYNATVANICWRRWWQREIIHSVVIADNIRLYVVYLFVFCCGLVMVGFTHIHQGYFTGTGATYYCNHMIAPVSEVTLKDMGKYITWIHSHQWYIHSTINHNKIIYIFHGIYFIWYILYMGYIIHGIYYTSND